MRAYWSIALAALVAAVVFFAVEAPVLSMGFVADDFVLTIEDAELPWYQSADRIYRPLRNGLYHAVLPTLFGTSPVPYRLVALGAFVHCLGLLGVLLRREGVRSEIVVGTLIIVALFPRNGRVLFGFSWIQEAFAAAGILGSLVFWRIYRESKARAAYIGSLFFFALGLGFKETVIVLPALLLAFDLLRASSVRTALTQRATWIPMLGFATVGLVWLAFVSSQRQGRLLAPDSESVYGIGHAAGAPLALARNLFNLLLPFSRPLALRDLSVAELLLASAEVVAIVALARWTKTERHWLFALLWVLVTLLPPSTFARANYGDQYVFLPMIGSAIAAAVTLEATVQRLPQVLHVLAAALTVYAIAAGGYLFEVRAEWHRAARAVETVAATLRGNAGADSPRKLIFVNLPHSFGRAPALGNGVRGLLLASGYSRAVELEVNLAPLSTVPEQERLLQRAGGCPPEPESGARIWIFRGEGLDDRSSRCALDAVSEDQRARPEAWRSP